VHGVTEIDRDVDYAPSEDPIEAMSLLTAAIVTGSELTSSGCRSSSWRSNWPLLEEMGLDHDRTDEYPAANAAPAGRT